MERAHQDAARRLQGLPQQCAGPAATSLMGWLSVQATIDMLLKRVTNIIYRTKFVNFKPKPY